MATYLVVTQVERLSTCINEDFCDTDPFKSVELYLGDGLEMAGYMVVTPAGETAQSLLRSPRIELYPGDGLEKADSLAVTLVK